MATQLGQERYNIQVSSLFAREASQQIILTLDFPSLSDITDAEVAIGIYGLYCFMQMLYKPLGRSARAGVEQLHQNHLRSFYSKIQIPGTPRISNSVWLYARNVP